MNHFAKAALAVTSVGFLAVATATPSAARDFPWGAAGAGFAAGAIVGSAAANSAYYYGPGYAYAPGYAYSPNYAYYGGPGYAYSPGYAYYGGPTYRSTTVYRSTPAYSAYASVGAPAVRTTGSCWQVTDSHRGYGYWGSCAAPRLTVTARQKAKGGSD